MKFKVYEHIFKTSNKSYIGYTSLSIEERLHKHFVNAMAGMETKFYKAIRKYGIADIKSICLFESNDELEAKNKEKEFIAEKNTFQTGYNMTLGGDGGNCLLYMTAEQKTRYIEEKRKQTTGVLNPNHSGLTDNDIINKAVEFYLIDRKFYRRKWFKYCKLHKIPVNYSKCRFNNEGYFGLVKKLKEQLTKLEINWTEEQFFLSKKERYGDLKNTKNGWISDDYIINKAIDYMIEHKVFVKSCWIQFCKSNKIPAYYAKSKISGRFDGKGFDGFIYKLTQKLVDMGIEFKFKKLKNQFDKEKND